jgi:hypothetical protein
MAAASLGCCTTASAAPVSAHAAARSISANDSSPEMLGGATQWSRSSFSRKESLAPGVSRRSSSCAELASASTTTALPGRTTLSAPSRSSAAGCEASNKSSSPLGIFALSQRSSVAPSWLSLLRPTCTGARRPSVARTRRAISSPHGPPGATTRRLDGVSSGAATGFRRFEPVLGREAASASRICAVF